MLENIKSFIDMERNDSTPFSLFYLNYIIAQQDLDLQLEFNRLLSNSKVTIDNVPKLITNAHEGLVNILEK